MIYIDNSATTKVDERVIEAMLPYLNEYYGNPGSRFYEVSTEAKKAVDQARESVARLINADPSEIVFTSSGSEANNFIIKGVADYLKNYEKKGNHLMTSSVEHKSALNAFRFLNGEIFMNKELGPKEHVKIDRGYELDIVGVNDFGLLDLEELEEKIKDTTILGSFMFGNNETGNLNKIDEIAEIFRSRDIYIHTDATQGVGKVKVDMDKTLVDAMSFSGHKIYGPKGAGAVYLRRKNGKNQKLTSLIHGGADQENGYRAGTPAVHDIVGFGKACELAYDKLNSYEKDLGKLTSAFKKILVKYFPDAVILTREGASVPGTISFALPNINNLELLERLADKMAFSAGSACSATSTRTGLLDEIGRPEYRENFFRVTFGKFNGEDELRMIENHFKELRESLEEDN